MVAVRRISLPSRLREGWGGACFLRRSATCPPLAPPASGRGTGQVQKRGAKHRRRFGSHGIGRNPVLFIEQLVGDEAEFDRKPQPRPQGFRSEEHTSELQPLMRLSYAVFCLKKKKQIEN